MCVADELRMKRGEKKGGGRAYEDEKARCETKEKKKKAGEAEETCARAPHSSSVHERVVRNTEEQNTQEGGNTRS